MATMRAAAVDSFGPPEALRIMELPIPEPGIDEVLVRVAYAGLQPADAAVRAGWAPPGSTPRFPVIPGNEFSGTVVAAGGAVSGFGEGDPVLGFRVLGCAAEYVTVPAAQLVRKPDALGWAEAGALSASGQTADTVVEALHIGQGETVVVHGAAGGVGSMAVQLARRRGATVIGTASEENHPYLRGLGAIPVTYGEGELGRIREAAPGRIDAAFDATGHGSLHTALRLVQDRRRLVTIADDVLSERLEVPMLRSDRSAARLGRLVALAARGELTVHIRQVFALEEVVAAHRAIEAGHGRGKMVLRVSGAL